MVMALLGVALRVPSVSLVGYSQGSIRPRQEILAAVAQRLCRRCTRFIAGNARHPGTRLRARQARTEQPEIKGTLNTY